MIAYDTRDLFAPTGSSLQQMKAQRPLLRWFYIPWGESQPPCLPYFLLSDMDFKCYLYLEWSSSNVIVILLSILVQQLNKSQKSFELFLLRVGLTMVINRMLQQSREDILSEFNNSQQLLKFATKANFKQLKLKKAKDVSALQLYQDTFYIGTKDSKVYKNEELQLKNERSFYPHCTSVYAMAASSELLVVVPLEEQQLIRIWNRESLHILHGYKGHEKQITSVIFLKDRKHLASASYDGTIRIWDVSQKFEQDQETKKYTNKYPLLCLLEIDDDNVAFGGDDCFITVWNWREEVVQQKIFAHLGSITSLSFGFSSLVYSTGGDAKIKVWRIELQLVKHKHFEEEFIEGEILREDRRIVFMKLLKQFEESMTQSVFTIKMGSGEVMAIDSRGSTRLMNHSLQVSGGKLRLLYTEAVRSIKMWRGRLLVVISRNGKGQLKEIGADLESLRREREKDIQIGSMRTNLIQVGKREPAEQSSMKLNEVLEMKQITQMHPN